MTLLIIINGTAGAKKYGIKPPDKAIKLGIKHITKALLIPKINKIIISMALTKGPVSHCKCIKKGTSIVMPANPKNVEIERTSTSVPKFVFISFIFLKR